LGETDTGPATILGNEFNAGVFECLPDRIHNSANWAPLAGLKVDDRPQTDAAPQCEIALAYIQETTSAAALVGRDVHHSLVTVRKKKSNVALRAMLPFYLASSR
jgi:hypothetical protein